MSCLYFARIRLGPENEAAFGNVISESKQSIFFRQVAELKTITNESVTIKSRIPDRQIITF
jgi:hypothetical protein